MTASAQGRVARAGLSPDPLDAQGLAALVTAAQDGAVVSFSGVVRDHDAGRTVTSLEYSAHPAAARVLAEVAAEVAAGHAVTLAAEHRTGHLRVGEVAIVVVVAAAHRAEAFRACAEAVDRIKAEVPIWKRQHYPEGAPTWTGSEGA